jgi:protein-L-isoaspartate O-methyltransferase
MECGGDSLPEHVAAAFRAVPRHPFVPDSPLEQAYDDDPSDEPVPPGTAALVRSSTVLVDRGSDIRRR